MASRRKQNTPMRVTESTGDLCTSSGDLDHDLESSLQGQGQAPSHHGFFFYAPSDSDDGPNDNFENFCESETIFPLMPADGRPADDVSRLSASTVPDYDVSSDSMSRDSDSSHLDCPDTTPVPSPPVICKYSMVEAILNCPKPEVIQSRHDASGVVKQENSQTAMGKSENAMDIPQTNGNTLSHSSANAESRERGSDPQTGERHVVFQDDSTLKAKIKKNDNADTYCGICDRNFSNKYYLKTHKFKMHGMANKTSNFSYNYNHLPSSNVSASQFVRFEVILI